MISMLLLTWHLPLWWNETSIYCIFSAGTKASLVPSPPFLPLSHWEPVLMESMLYMLSYTILPTLLASQIF